MIPVADFLPVKMRVVVIATNTASAVRRMIRHLQNVPLLPARLNVTYCFRADRFFSHLVYFVKRDEIFGIDSRSSLIEDGTLCSKISSAF
jgi:hypothetical protein